MKRRRARVEEPGNEVARTETNPVEGEETNPVEGEETNPVEGEQRKRTKDSVESVTHDTRIAERYRELRQEDRTREGMNEQTVPRTNQRNLPG